MTFPTTLPGLAASNPTPSDTLATGPHSTLHSAERNNIDALGAKVGINGSAVTTSHDYKLSSITGSNKTQPLDATLTALAGTLTAADKIPYATATDVAGELTLDTDGTLGANSDIKLASQKATRTYVTAQVASANTLSTLSGATYSTTQHLMNFALSSGRSSGGEITASGTANCVDIAAGTGFLRAVDSDVATQSFCNWSASVAASVPSGTTRYIGVQYDSGSAAVIVKTTDSWDLDTEFPLGVVVNEGGTRYIANLPWITADNQTNIIERFDAMMPIARDNRLGGLILSNSGTRNVAVTAGSLLGRMSEFTITAIDTSAAGSFDAYYRDGSGGWTKQSGSTQWENTKYDNGTGTLASITVLQYASRWFYLMTDGSLAMLYGRADNATIAAALNEAVPSSAPDRITKEGMLIGRFIIQASASTPSITQSAFGTAFTAAQVTSHTDLTNIGTNTHAQIDTHIAATGTAVHGLGTMSTQAASAVAITGGTIVGITDLAVADGGTGSSTAAGAATNLGVGTGDSPQFTAVNVGNATDTTLSRASAGDLAVEGKTIYRVDGTDVAVADGGTGSSTAAGAATNLGLGTGDSPQFTAVNVGNATDTTITRTGAGDIAVEGNGIYRVGGTDVAVADGGTGASTAAGAVTNLGLDNTKIATITFIIDGGGSAITTGIKGDLLIPFACTINSATLLADQSGSIVIDVWKDTYANYPPTVADTITASAKPTITTATKSQDTTLTGWTTSVTAGDTIRFNVDSITTITRVTIAIKVTKT